MSKCCLCGNNIEIFSGAKFTDDEKVCDICKNRIKTIETLTEANITNIVDTRKKLIEFMEDAYMKSDVKEELQKIMDASYEFTSKYIISDFESERDSIYNSDDKIKYIEPEYPPKQKYEYKVETVSDSAVLGKVPVKDMETVLRSYAQKGWRLHTALTNEMGKNAVVGVNATVNETIFIFERDVIHEVVDDSEDEPENDF